MIKDNRDSRERIHLLRTTIECDFNEVLGGATLEDMIDVLKKHSETIKRNINALAATKPEEYKEVEYTTSSQFFGHEGGTYFEIKIYGLENEKEHALRMRELDKKEKKNEAKMLVEKEARKAMYLELQKEFGSSDLGSWYEKRVVGTTLF